MHKINFAEDPVFTITYMSRLIANVTITENPHAFDFWFTNKLKMRDII